MEPYFDVTYEMRHFEMNRFGEASPTIMLALLEEAAAEHCYAIDHSLYQLLDRNIGWVLSSGLLRMERFPRYKEKITIRTWLSGYSAVRGFRENLIYDEQQNIIGRGKGLWIFFDIERRRPSSIFPEIINRWSFLNKESIAFNPAGKILPAEKGEITHYFEVQDSEIDMYRHVNNVIYLHWLLDSIPYNIIETCYMNEINGHFISEVSRGDKVTVLTNFDESNNSFIHTIRNTDSGKVCALATTKWKERNS